MRGPAGSPELSEGLVIAGRYRVERALGHGGMGSVYCVRHVRTDERLALKLLHPGILADLQAVQRFRREARTPAQIDSDHVVRVVDADTAPELGDAPFLVMELLRGRDLEHESEARGPLPPAEVLSHLRQAARALDKAHRMGIVHRDLKPENLFLAQREDGSVCLKVLDFGIAKLLAGAPSGMTAPRTRTGAVFGTPLYMAPEQARGDNARIAPQTDVWALGLIAHKLLTGKQFWSFTTLNQLLLLITTDPIARPSERAPGLGAAFPAFDAWFARCCARPQHERFPSTGEAVEALAAVLGLASSAGEVAVAAAPVLPPAASVPPDAFASTLPVALAATALAPTARDVPAPTLASTQPLERTAPLPRPGPSGLAVAVVLVLSLSVLTAATLLVRRGAPPVAATQTAAPSETASAAPPPSAPPPVLQASPTVAAAPPPSATPPVSVPNRAVTMGTPPPIPASDRHPSAPSENHPAARPRASAKEPRDVDGRE